VVWFLVLLGPMNDAVQIAEDRVRWNIKFLGYLAQSFGGFFRELPAGL